MYKKVEFPEVSSEVLETIRKVNEEQTKLHLQEFDKTLDLFVDKLANEGWTIPSQIGIYAVNVIGRTEEVADITELFRQFYTVEDYSKLKSLIQNVHNSGIKAGLVKLTDECWTAFQAKLYSVCAHSLVSVVEGILSEYSDNKNDIRMMKVCQKHVDQYPSDGGSILKHVWMSYNAYIRNLYQKSDFEQDEPNGINRHWLLHGRSDFDIDELDCIRLFNAVDSLCMIIAHDKKGQQTET